MIDFILISDWPLGCNFLCPSYVQGVDFWYVVNHGIVYWLNWNNHAQKSPQYIVHFLIFTNKFGFILIPVEARVMIQRPLICEACLYYAVTIIGGLSEKLKKAIKNTLGSCRFSFGIMDQQNLQIKDTSQPTRGTQFTNTKEEHFKWWNSHFVQEIIRRWKSKDCSLFAHFGYFFDWTKSIDWVMNMSALTGETSPLHFPFLLTTEGWFQIVGVENGINCIRYSSMGNKSYLLTWNPIFRYSKIIYDPNKHYCEGCPFLYSFMYYPNMLDYALLHVYMKNSDSSTCVLTIYTRFRRNWNVIISCPEKARRLNPAYVSVNGVVYWVSVITNEDIIQPPYIVSFNIITYSFD
ncbi:hypothetical protein Ahy_A09g044900 [Arachis hypogaea]|uniref:F-box associated domain-containing protein n=1 Tax=Arachis hypogaea TaxID=3818 RepID=A0A445BL34_ARAHY|nr:hypothetical protein Ahy_A09g044900 [Arachis hypogaea]